MSKVRLSFDWIQTFSYGKRGPKFYVAGPVLLALEGLHPSNDIKAKASYESRASGPNHCFATFKSYCDAYANSRFGFELKKHFLGPNAHVRARAWLNYMLNNCPEYGREFREDKEQTP